MTKNQEIIQKIETKIQEMQTMLKNYKSEIKQCENTLSGLIRQATELKTSENNKKFIK